MPSSTPCCPPTDPRYTFVGSPYGPRPAVSGAGTDFHPGIDVRARGRDDAASFGRFAGLGLPVYAVGDAVVFYTGTELGGSSGPAAGHTDGYGNLVVLEHPQWQSRTGSWFTVYAQLADFRVRVGQRVRCGEQIGRIGSTTNGRFADTEPVLHFEVRCRFAEPSSFGTTDPVPGTNDPAFLDWAEPETVTTVRRRGARQPTFMEQPGHGTTVDPIWWLGQRGVRVLRVTSGEHLRGTIMGGAPGPEGYPVLPLGRVQNYAPAVLAQGQSFGPESAQVSAGLAGMRGLEQGLSAREARLAAIGALAQIGVINTPAQLDVNPSGRVEPLELDAEGLPYQPPVPNRTENPLIPVTDPLTLAPPSTGAVLALAGFGAIVGLALASEFLAGKRTR